MTKKRGRVRVYASAEDRHRAYRLRLGIKVVKPVTMADGSVKETDKCDEQRTETKAS
jgi:hypothetical protein